MKTRMVTLIFLATIVGMFAEQAAAQTVITSVTRRNSTQTPPALGGILQDKSLSMVDRTHVYRNIPAYLLGIAEYVKQDNDDRTTATYEVDVVLAVRADVYLFLDYRIGDNSNADPPALSATMMPWVAAMGFVDTGDKLDLDESNDGSINQYFRIYKAQFPAGTITLKEQNSGGINMYGIAAIKVDPTFNPPPAVDAGGDQYLVNPVFPQDIAMAATVTDEDPKEGPAGTLTYAWSFVSGPVLVSFNDTTIEDPIVTIPQPGEYVLKLTASDGEKSSEDTLTIYVNDPSKNTLMAYWNFESMTMENKRVEDVAKGNDGLWTTTDPNYPPVLIPGWVPGSTKALDFTGQPAAHVDVTIADTEPNFLYSPRYAATISAWVKVSAFTRSWANVVSKGDDSWKLVRQSRSGQNNNAMMVQFVGTTPGAGQPANGPNGLIGISVNDNLWHHVCGTYDGQRIRFYVDGVLDCDGPYTGRINASTYPIMIGANSQQSGREWDGAMDEIRVYNYALSESEIRALTAQGKTKPFVNAGPDGNFLIKPGQSYPLAGIAVDYGSPDGMNSLWTTVSGPDGAEAVFANPGSPTSTVTFPKAGVYTLKLTAVDELASVEDTVVITTTTPTCADVVKAGLTQKTDLNKDCYVNLQDLAILLQTWTQCNDPEDEDCIWPF